MWEGRCFSLPPWITCSTVSPVPGALPGEAREKLEWPWCSETFHVFGYTQGMQRATLWTFVAFFCSASPRAPGGTRNLRNRRGNCTRSSSQLLALLRLAPSAVEGWVCDVSWKVGFVGVGRGRANPSCLCPLPSGPSEASQVHWVEMRLWNWIPRGEGQTTVLNWMQSPQSPGRVTGTQLLWREALLRDGWRSQD